MHINDIVHATTPSLVSSIITCPLDSIKESAKKYEGDEGVYDGESVSGTVDDGIFECD